MTSRIDQDRVKILLEQSGLNDRQIGERIGADQSTVWRLRNGRILKVSRYIVALEKLAPEAARHDSLESLKDLAGQSPALRAVLAALMQFMHEEREPSSRRSGR